MKCILEAGGENWTFKNSILIMQGGNWSLLKSELMAVTSHTVYLLPVTISFEVNLAFAFIDLRFVFFCNLNVEALYAFSHNDDM